MPKNKLGPYILIVLLLIVLFFILGVRYGQKVEQANKVINYLISLPPTKPPPTTAPLQFTAYENDICGLKFLYPSSLKKEKGTSSSAQFSDNGKTAVDLSCEKGSAIEKLLTDKNIATEEIKLQNQKIVAKNKEGLLIFQIKNPKNYKIVVFSILKSLLPLFDTSLQFLAD